MDLEKVCLFKLVSGEVLVSEFHIDKNHYILIRPMSIQTFDVFNKQMEIKGTQVSVKPWIDNTPTDRFVIPKKMIMTRCAPYPELLKTYIDIRHQEDMLDAGDELEEIADQYYNSLGMTASNKGDLDNDFDNFDSLDEPRNPRITF